MRKSAEKDIEFEATCKILKIPKESFQKLIGYQKLNLLSLTLKRQHYKIVKHTQTICRHIANELFECLTIFLGKINYEYALLRRQNMVFFQLPELISTPSFLLQSRE